MIQGLATMLTQCPLLNVRGCCDIIVYICTQLNIHIVNIDVHFAKTIRAT